MRNRYNQHVLGVGYPGGAGYHPGAGYGSGVHGYVMGGGRRYGSRRGVVGQASPYLPMGGMSPEEADRVAHAFMQGQAAAFGGAQAQAMAPFAGTPQFAPQRMVMVPQPQMVTSDCDSPQGYTPPQSFLRPPWRGNMLAPGLEAPGEGHVPLPLTGTAGGLFTFAAQAPQVFTARPQKPYKGTRLICIASHIPAVPGGPTTPARVQGQIFVGTDPQQGQLGQLDLESLGAPTAFDTWLSCNQAEPGVEIQVQSSLSTPLLIAGESILVNMYFIGHWVS